MNEKSLANLKKFKPGKSGNPHGRPTEASIFNEALKEVEKKKKKTLYQHACERAFVNDKVLIAILNKKLPDLQELSGNEDKPIKFLMRYAKPKK